MASGNKDVPQALLYNERTHSEGLSSTPSSFTVIAHRTPRVKTMAKARLSVNNLLRDSLVWAATATGISFGNSVGGYLEAFATGAHKSAQASWDMLLSVTGDDPFTLYIYGTVILASFVYWTVGLSMLAVDLSKKPIALSQYKLIPNANRSLNGEKIFRVIKQVMLNQVLVGIPFLLATYYWFIRMFHPLPPVQTFPSFTRIFVDILICLAADEVCFYYIHRLLHHRRIYKYVHKKHHEWTTPIAIAAAYCHPIEYLLGNLLPIFSGLILAGSHVVVVWMWTVIVLLVTCNDHGGYHFPFAPSQEFHYFHHLQFNNCFGLFGVMDYLHGTDKLFRSSMAFKRHFVSFTTEPLAKRYPNSGSGSGAGSPES